MALPSPPFLPCSTPPQVKSLLDHFLLDVATMAEEFFKVVPYSHEKTTAVTALEFVELSKVQVADARKRVRVWYHATPHCCAVLCCVWHHARGGGSCMLGMKGMELATPLCDKPSIIIIIITPLCVCVCLSVCPPPLWA